ncbi:hypothetical protein KSC_082960 [Ktedonobacter sp. SOSP1-52]|uniref:hypothetical protein n=1 Tax=Ktedonobacter sp. SOSP1-52 TaxID=2778366 RepID=UPI0019162942|nr:hypothetical protein [Ktedonobacter sp. SOSP1-52]GHO69404.1 hypothetical protein KSC_082960 [Ktedonobacter sp. SOSP1-52]
MELDVAGAGVDGGEVVLDGFGHVPVVGGHADELAQGVLIEGELIGKLALFQ